jgi:hypothetical protein
MAPRHRPVDRGELLRGRPVGKSGVPAGPGLCVRASPGGRAGPRADRASRRKKGSTSSSGSGSGWRNSRCGW